MILVILCGKSKVADEEVSERRGKDNYLLLGGYKLKKVYLTICCETRTLGVHSWVIF